MKNRQADTSTQIPASEAPAASDRGKHAASAMGHSDDGFGRLLYRLAEGTNHKVLAAKAQKTTSKLRAALDRSRASMAPAELAGQGDDGLDPSASSPVAEDHAVGAAESTEDAVADSAAPSRWKFWRARVSGVETIPPSRVTVPPPKPRSEDVDASADASRAASVESRGDATRVRPMATMWPGALHQPVSEAPRQGKEGDTARGASTAPRAQEPEVAGRGFSSQWPNASARSSHDAGIEAERRALEQSLVEARAAAQAMKNDIAKRERAARAEVEAIKARNGQLEAEQSAVRGAARRIAEGKEALAQALEAATAERKRAATLEARVQRLEQEVKEASHSRDGAAVRERDRTVVQLEAALREARGQREQQAKRTEDAQGELNEAKAAYERRVEELRVEAVRSKAERDRASKLQVAAAAEAARRIEESERQLVGARAEAERQVRLLKEEMARHAVRWGAVSESLRGEAVESARQLALALNRAETTKSALEGQIGELGTQLAREAASYQAQAEEMAKQLNAPNHAADQMRVTLEGRIASLTEELERLAEDRRSADKALRQREDQLARFRDEARREREQRQSLAHARIAQLLGEKQAAEAARDAAMQSLSTRESRAESARAELAPLEAERVGAEERLRIRFEEVERMLDEGRQGHARSQALMQERLSALLEQKQAAEAARDAAMASLTVQMQHEESERAALVRVEAEAACAVEAVRVGEALRVKQEEFDRMLGQARQDQEQGQTRMQERVAALQAEKESAESVRDAVMGSLAAQTQEMDNARAEVARLEAERVGAEERLRLRSEEVERMIEEARQEHAGSQSLANERIGQLLEEKKALEAERDVAIESLATRVKEAERAQAELARLEAERVGAEERLRIRSEEVERMIEEARQEHAGSQSLANERIGQLLEEKKAIEAERDVVMAALAIRMQQEESDRAALEILQVEAVRAEEALRAKQGEFDRWREEVRQEQEQSQTLVQERIGTLQAEKESAESMRGAVMGSLAAQTQEMDNARAELARLEAERVGAEERLRLRSEEVERMIEEARQEHAGSQSLANERIGQLLEEKKAFEAERDVAMAALAIRMQQEESDRAALEILQVEAVRAEEALRAKQEEFDRWRDDVRQEQEQSQTVVQERIATLHAEKQSAESTRDAVVVSLAAQVQETESARAELARLEVEAVRAEEALRAKQEEFDRWRDDARQEQEQSQTLAQERVATLQAEKEFAESTRDAVMGSLAAQTQELDSARAELARLEAERVGAEQRLRIRSEEVEQMLEEARWEHEGSQTLLQERIAEVREEKKVVEAARDAAMASIAIRMQQEERDRAALVRLEAEAVRAEEALRAKQEEFDRGREDARQEQEQSQARTQERVARLEAEKEFAESMREATVVSLAAQMQETESARAELARLEAEAVRAEQALCAKQEEFDRGREDARQEQEQSQARTQERVGRLEAEKEFAESMREATVVSLAAQVQETESARAELARLEAEAVRAEQALCAKQEEFDRWRDDVRQEQEQSQAHTQERVGRLEAEKESAESMREAMVVSLAAQMQETESARAELARLEAEAVRAEQALCAKQEEFDRWREDARQEQKQSQARTQERIATLVVEKESAESMRDAVAVTLAAQMQETESARAELERLVESESSLLQRVSGMEEQQGRTLLDLQSQVRETASQRDDARAGLEKFELERVRLSAVAEEQGRTISELEARIAEQHTLAESLILDRAAAAEEFARLDGRADQERREAEGKLQELEREHSLALVGRELMVREHALSLAAQDQRLAEVLALAETEAHRSAMEAEQIEQSYEDRNAKMTQAHAEVRKEWEARIVELEKRNSDAKAQAQVEARHAASQREQLRQSYEQRIDQSREDHLRALVERDSQLKAVEWKLSNATTQRVEDGSLHAAAVAQVRQDYELRLAKAREEHMREVSVRDARVAALQRELAAMLREAIVQHAENTIQIPKPLGRISGSLRGLQGVPVSDDGSVDQAWQDWFDAPSEESPAARSVPWESAARAVRNGTGR